MVTAASFLISLVRQFQPGLSHLDRTPGILVEPQPRIRVPLRELNPHRLDAPPDDRVADIQPLRDPLLRLPAGQILGNLPKIGLGPGSTSRHRAEPITRDFVENQ